MTTKGDNRPDWPAIKVSYEAGGISDRALARQHGVSLAAVQKQAKKGAWKRPPGTKQRGGAVSRASAAGTALAVKAASAAKTPVETLAGADGHKGIVNRGRDLVGRLMDELSATTSHVGEIEEMIEAETAHDKDGRRRYAMMQSVTLSTRAGILKNLALAAKTLAEAAPGKREERAEAANKAGKGRFAVPAGPKLVVHNDGE